MILPSANIADLKKYSIMEILFFIILGIIIIFPLVWKSSNTREKSDILSTVGLDLSQTAKKKSENKDKIKRANVQIECIKDNGRPLALPYMGAIHISQAKKDYLEKLSDAFRIGDIIQAKVVKVTGDNVDLGSTDDDCGVLKAMCTRCRDYMHTTQKADEVQCNSCNKKEKRKVSKNYIND